ncbi:VOC family protein [Tautonia plasticadhaerens]|uniref:VOC family protein n=1 Tax=Tautonia plasticadhaerens TaxID=2527974 RepID=UPI0036F34DC9
MLGFEETRAVEGWSFLRRGACRLRLGHCPEARPMSDPSCIDHSWFLYLPVDDAEGLFEEYRARGASIWHPIGDRPWGMREFAVVTPDGHRIVFGQDLGRGGPDPA